MYVYKLKTFFIVSMTKSNKITTWKQILTLNIFQTSKHSHLCIIITGEITAHKHQVNINTLDHFGLTEQLLQMFRDFLHFQSIYDWIEQRII